MCTILSLTSSYSDHSEGNGLTNLSCYNRIIGSNTRVMFDCWCDGFLDSIACFSFWVVLAESVVLDCNYVFDPKVKKGRREENRSETNK